jgi:NTP pyrophosphatase (non-canonical NTP hydrolase)
MNMTEKQTEKALEILSYYGEDKQRRQLVEECAELIQAVTKLERAQESGDVGKITEKTLELVGELVDVRIMVQQITMSLFQEVSKDMIYEQMEYKLQRQLDRIERERRRKNESGVN